MTDVMIEASGLGKEYGSFVALKDASFELRRGEILGFLGPNGAGKSTTMKILTCFIAPTTGTATVAGADIWDDPIGVRESIGYLPESTPLYQEMLVLEYLEWVAQMRGLKGEAGNKRILKVVEEVGLGDVIAKSIHELSKGYKQRVGLAQALIHEPPILILDEPMSGLDPNQAVEIRSLIKEIGKERTIILSTHNLAEVQVTCQRVLIIDKGRIVADDTPEGLARSGGGPRYRLTVLKDKRLADGGYRDASNGEGAIKAAFSKVDGVLSVTTLKDRKGELEVEVAVGTDSDEDARPELFRAAVDNGLVLVGFSTKTQNLEQIFRNLTTAAPEDELEDDEEWEDEEDEEEVEDEETASDDDDDDDEEEE